jgi:membrane fusion protein
MAGSLFRPEALEFQKQYREFGQVGRLQSSSAKMLAWLLTIAVGSLIVFICLAGYTRKETVAGYLAPALGTSSIFRS